jgi:2,3,4,5-tetrahydropyridine-2-carboxylate N-succinyltransferase
VTEGVLVGAGAVLGAQVCLTSSTPIIDVTGAEPVTHKGRVPPRSVVVPGTRKREFAAGTFEVGCALIIGQRTQSTDDKTSLNNALRDFGISS